MDCGKPNSKKFLEFSYSTQNSKKLSGHRDQEHLMRITAHSLPKLNKVSEREIASYNSKKRIEDKLKTLYK